MPSSSSMIRIGVIGYGYWGPNLVRNLAETDGAAVTRVTDLRQARLALVAKRYPSVAVSTDYRDILTDPAIDAVAARSDVDGTRLGIWGSSYSGGQVLVAASRRPQVVKAVSSQVPFVHGLSSALRYPIRHQPAAMWMAIRDAVRGDGEEPVYMPIISADGGTAALICDECVEGYSKLVPNTTFQSTNRLSL